jgi:phospholipase A1
MTFSILPLNLSLLGANPPDNPDIDDYLGYGEARASYDLGRHRLGAIPRSVEHPTVQLDGSCPLSDRVRVYAQYFNGCGESLLDYDHSVNRIGAGFLLEDGRCPRSWPRRRPGAWPCDAGPGPVAG